MNRLSRSSMLFFPWLALCACDAVGVDPGAGAEAAPPNASPNSVKATPSPGINGVLLDTLQLAGDHRIEFYDFGGGGLAARETMAEGAGPELLQGMTATDTLAEMFTRLAPGRPVPEAIASADARAIQFRQAEAKAALGLPARPVPSQRANAGATETLATSAPSTNPTSVAAVETRTAAVTSCSGDRYGDNWGDSWFLNNYCYNDPTQFRECHTNWGWYENSWYFGSALHLRQFEGDFQTPGSLFAAMRRCDWFPLDGWECYYRPVLDLAVGPRHVESWNFTTGNATYMYAKGSSPCGHLGLEVAHD